MCASAASLYLCKATLIPGACNASGGKTLPQIGRNDNSFSQSHLTRFYFQLWGFEKSQTHQRNIYLFIYTLNNKSLWPLPSNGLASHCPHPHIKFESKKPGKDDIDNSACFRSWKPTHWVEITSRRLTKERNKHKIMLRTVIFNIWWIFSNKSPLFLTFKGCGCWKISTCNQISKHSHTAGIKFYPFWHLK